MITLGDTSLCVLRTRSGALERRDTQVWGERAALPPHLRGLGQVQGPAQVLYAYDAEGVVELHPETLQVRARVRTSSALSALGASQDGQTLAGLDCEGQLVMWHMPTAKRWRLAVGASAGDALAVSPDGQWVAWGHVRDRGGGVRLWRLKPSGPVCVAHALDRRHVRDPTQALTRPGCLRLSFNAYTVAVYASCQRLPSEGAGGWLASVQCYDLAQGGLLWQAPLGANLAQRARALEDTEAVPGDLVLTPDAKKLYVASGAGVYCLLDARDGALIKMLAAPTSLDVHRINLDTRDQAWVQSARDGLHALNV